jgi:type IV secretory pathway TraG/TraD family ATPase VirD4
MNNELLRLYMTVYLILTICCVGTLLYVSFVRSRVLGSLILTAVTFGIWRFNADLVHFIQQQYLGYPALRKALHAIPGFYPDSSHSWQILGAGVLVFSAAIVGWLVVIINIYFNQSDYKRGTRLLYRNEMMRELKRSGVRRFGPVKVGTFPVPTYLETRSMGIFGEPGVGKTQLVKSIVSTYKAKGDPVVAVDPGGELCQKYWQKGDFILSPVLKGSVPWSPFSEVKAETDCKRVADASIPNGTGESVAWNGYARELYAHSLRMLIKEGRTTNRDLIEATQITSIEELRIRAEGTALQRLFEKGNERMASSVLSVMTRYLSALELLDPDAGETSFSVTEWATGKHAGRGLWMPYYETDAAATSALRCTWINLLINAALSLLEDPDRRILFVLDELAANGQIDSLSGAVSRGRKYGLTLVLALQNVSQLFAIYGRDYAQSILGSLGHVVVLRTPDPETSEYLSRTIGDVEVFKQEVSVNSEGGATRRFNQEIKRPVLASEISNLPDRVGYLKIATVGWVKFGVPLVKSANKVTLVRKPMAISKNPCLVKNTPINHISDFDEV